MVNGEVLLETRGGRVDAVAVRSPPLLQSSGATYAQSADWGVDEAEGFIKLFGMSSTLWAQVNAPADEGQGGGDA
jgi:argininosuccinate synthase